jgi:NAD(P)-dependent dehydrogenase (short-subunit alcohol dehydrogenase family)
MGNRLEGRVAIVTGSGRGLGAATAKLIAEEGASVVVNDVGGALDGTGEAAAPADQTVQEIRAAGGTAVASYDSVAEFDTAGKIVQTAIDNFGRLDIMVHPAGILRDRMVFNMTEAEWDAVLQVHLYGAFNMIKHSVPHMIKQKYGRLVLFSSGSGLGSSGQANYSMAKEGMVGLARSLAPELAPYNVTINAVYPGGATRMTESIPQSTTAMRQESRPQAVGEEDDAPIVAPAEAGAPENNAPKVTYLVSEAGGAITGQVIGTSGWVVSLYSPRHVVRSIHKNGRWTLDELRNLLPISIGMGLENPSPPAPPRQ